MILGTVPDTVGVSLGMLELHGVDLDCRGTLIIHKDSVWGFWIKVITLGHETNEGVNMTAPPVDRPVIVDKDAWICSCAQLYNCHIGEGAIVTFGTVVRSQEVKPYTMVAGNPARVIAHWDGQDWVYVGSKFEVLE